MNEIHTETLRALRYMADVWPKRFGGTEAARKCAMFAKPLDGIDPSVVFDAADACIGKSTFDPTPKEFAEAAWHLHHAKHPVASGPQPIKPLEGEALERLQRLDARGRFIMRYCLTGSFSEMCAVWALVSEMCETPEERAAYNDGTIGKRKVKAAIRAHREGRIAFGVSSKVAAAAAAAQEMWKQRQAAQAAEVGCDSR